MKRVLMNKNTEVLLLEYNEVLNGFDKIYDVININYAPLILKNYYTNEKDEVFVLKKIDD